MVKIANEEEIPVDKKIRYCQICRRCWETYHDGNRVKFTRYHIEFPNIGKKREDCRKCTQK